MSDLLLVAALCVPSLAFLFVRRPRRRPLAVVTYLPTPSRQVRVDHRTPAQRAADQERFDRLGLPRKAS